MVLTIERVEWSFDLFLTLVALRNEAFFSAVEFTIAKLFDESIRREHLLSYLRGDKNSRSTNVDSLFSLFLAYHQLPFHRHLTLPEQIENEKEASVSPLQSRVSLMSAIVRANPELSSQAVLCICKLLQSK